MTLESWEKIAKVCHDDLDLMKLVHELACKYRILIV